MSILTKEQELKALQMNRILQKFVKYSNFSDSEAMEVADFYESWDSRLKSLKSIKVDEIFKYGVNDDGETQLYKAVKNHKPSKIKPPNKSDSFRKLGYTEDNNKIWSQPLSKVDAYQKEDIVSYNNKLYKSIVDVNVLSPDNTKGWVAI